jgi:hypothetical protein
MPVGSSRIAEGSFPIVPYPSECHLALGGPHAETRGYHAAGTLIAALRISEG